MRAHRHSSPRGPVAWALLLLLLVPGAGLRAQRAEFGSITGRVVDERGIAVPDATLTLSHDGLELSPARAEVSGRFRLDELAPGDYSLLVEQVGYQPVRLTGIRVLGGATLRMTARVERRPPPITAVEERVYRGVGVAPGGEVLLGDAVRGFARDGSASGAASGLTGAVTSFDGRPGASANGVAPNSSLLVVDGLEELMIRHPGLPAEGGSAPLFGRRGISELQSGGFLLDAGLPAASGASLVMTTGVGRPGIRPWASWSGSALAAAEDNPADSSGATIAAGIEAAGGDASRTEWGFSAGFERRREPGAAVSATADEALIEAIGSAGAVGGLDLPFAFAPTVHSWEGFTGSGVLRARVGRSGRFTARFAGAGWEEESPRLFAATNGDGALLKASDISGAASYQLSGEDWNSVTRIGVSSTSREWTPGGFGQVGIVSDGIALGAGAGLRGDFSERRIQVGETIAITQGAHELTLGGLVARRNFTYDWLANGGGAVWYGSVADIAASRFASVTVAADGDAPELSITEYAVFAQDRWSATPSLTVTGGIRYQGEKLPDDAFTSSAALGARLGINNGLVPTGNKSAVGPRLGLDWDASGRGETVVSLSGGLVPGRHDLATFAEAARYDGSVLVARFAGVPTTPTVGGGLAPDALAAAYTLYGDQVRAPRTAVLDASLRQALAPGTVLSLSGGYRHGDYHLRRTDFNRPASPLARDADGREIWGALTQFDGLVLAEPGSNRRFAEFDQVWGLASTGYIDHYQATIALDRNVGGGVSVAASYTWAKTEDNLVGQLSGDPADRVSPIDAAANGTDWSVGRSDLDIPGRAVASLRYDAPGPSRLSVAARWRWRSGLPFTPGFRDGVDANGDGSVRNDPVALGSVTGLAGLLSGAGCDAGTGGFAGRNSCREEAVHALDLQLGIRLPMAGNRLRLTVDAFNLVSSETGIVDRAAVLVDPDRSITTTSGRLALPLMLNDHFGQLLARRNDPRTIRIGLALEN